MTDISDSQWERMFATAQRLSNLAAGAHGFISGCPAPLYPRLVHQLQRTLNHLGRLQ